MSEHEDEAEDEAEDEDTRAILERRRAFIQKALAGIAVVAAGCDDPFARPCLSVVKPEEPKTATTAGDKLQIRPIDDRASKDAGAAASGETTGEGDPKVPPQPCLSVRPAPCLVPPQPPKKRR